MYLDLAAPHGSGSILLDGMEQLPLVCLDNLHAVAGQRAWEQAVLRLFEELRARGHRLALAANAPASRLGFCLPDLRTRLQWGLVCQLHPLRDEEKIQAMCRRARMRSFVLPENVAEYLLRNVSRGIRELLDWIDNLDVASLSAQRKVTVPFVRQILRDGAAGGSGRGEGAASGSGSGSRHGSSHRNGLHSVSRRQEPATANLFLPSLPYPFRRMPCEPAPSRSAGSVW